MKRNCWTCKWLRIVCISDLVKKIECAVTDISKYSDSWFYNVDNDCPYWQVRWQTQRERRIDE